MKKVLFASTALAGLAIGGVASAQGIDLFGEARNGTAVAVLNLQGQLFLPTPIHPFRVVDALVEEARAQTPVVLVDFHAEATSEKVAMGHGRARDAHARTDERRARPPRGDRGDHRRGDDRPPRLGDRRPG